MLPLLLVAVLDTGDVPTPKWGEDPNAPRGYAFFGDGLADVGDLDGDGLDEFTIADSRGSEPATVWILSGSDAHEVARLTSPERGRYFGSLVARVPDVNHDGVDEIVVAAPPRWGTYLTDLAYLYCGRTLAFLRTHPPMDEPRPVAKEMVLLSDFDGDDVPEFVTGDPIGMFFGTFSCRSGRSGKLIWEESPWPSWRNVELSTMRNQLATIGDFDRDGVRDFIWSPDNSWNGSPGLVFISSGKSGRALQVLARGLNLDILRFGPKG